MRLQVVLLLVVVMMMGVVHAAHPALQALVQGHPGAAHVKRMLASVKLAGNTPSSGSDSSSGMFDNCTSNIESFDKIDVKTIILLNSGISSECRAQLNGSEPSTIALAQLTLDLACSGVKGADCFAPEQEGTTSMITSCTTTYSCYTQKLKSDFKTAVEGATPKGRMVQQDMRFWLKMAFALSYRGQSQSFFMSMTQASLGKISSFPAVCTNADLGQLAGAVAAIGQKMHTALQSVGPCMSAVIAAKGGSLSADLSAGISYTLYPDFDSSLNAVESSKITGQYSSGALHTCAAGSMLVTLLAAVAAMLARKAF